MEGGSSGGAYFRTSLYDYQKVRAQARYSVTASLSLSADFTILNNHNPLPGVGYDYLAHQESLSVLWSPAGGKRWDFEGSYSRSDLRSNIGYLSPQDLAPQTSLYRDNSHTATALFNLTLPQVGQEIFDLMLRVASGHKTCAERLGHKEFVPWRIGPMM